MAITVQGSGSSATTSVTIPTHAVGDLIVIMARDAASIPTAPAAGGTVPTWTTPTNASGLNNSLSWRVGVATATATNHTSGTWTNAGQMHVLVLRPTSGNTLAVGDSPAQGGANNTQTMIYPAFTLTAGKVSNLVIRYGVRGVADTEVRTDGAFTSGGTWHTEQPATTPTSAVFSKVVTASEGTFTATPVGSNAGYRCGSLEITETAAATNWSQPVNDAIAGTDAEAASAGKTQADAAAGTDATSFMWAALRTQPDTAAGTDAQAKAVTHPLADAATVTDAVDPQLTVPGTDHEQPVDDAIAGTDARAKATTHPLADTAAGTDATARAWTAHRTQPDAIAGTDAQAKTARHPLTDAITGTDARARVWAAKLTIADGVSVDDTFDTSAAGASEEEIDDAATVTDSILVSLGARRTIGDSLTATDASATQTDYVRQPTDAVTVADALERAWAIFETQDDALTVTDAVNARIPPSRWLPGTDTDWPADTDEDWEAQTDDRWLVSAESRW